METTFPLLKDRIQSTLIDTVLIIVLMYVFASILDNFEEVPDWVRALMFVAIFIAYEPVCTALGCTLGNYLNKIRVRRYDNTAKRINIFQSIIRYPVKLMLGWISFLTINSNPQKRAIHDFASGSVMIKV